MLDTILGTFDRYQSDWANKCFKKVQTQKAGDEIINALATLIYVLVYTHIVSNIRSSNYFSLIFIILLFL